MSYPEEPSRAERRRNAHLPVLSWLLVGLVFLYCAARLATRPPRQERLEMAAVAEALRAISGLYVEKVDSETLYRGAMRGMVAALGDKYSSYLTPVQMGQLTAETKGEYAGVGIVFMARDGGGLVRKVMPEGPAARAGIEPGDVITQVGGESVAELPIDKVAVMIRGKVGTEVTLTLLRESTGESFDRTLTREKISLPNVEWKMLGDDIGLLSLATFDSGCAKEVREGLRQLQKDGARGLILDLRSNPGGLVNQATSICDMFLDKGLILSTKGRGEEPQPSVLATPGTEVPADMPIIVLVDHWTASSAEILAGALQAHGRATVVGTGTVGKGSVNSVLRLRDGSGLVLTVSHYQLEGGMVIQGVGIKPDVVAGEMPERPRDATPEQFHKWFVEERAGAEKAQMDAAMKLMRQKLSG